MNDDQHGGMVRDLPLLARRRLVGGMAMAGVTGFGAWMLGAVPRQVEANVTGTALDGTVCLKDPEETSGPYSADGTNRRGGQTVNALTESGVVRGDMRGSFGPLVGRAEGVPLALEITLVDVGAGCAPLGGHAIYLWQADSRGRYSLYDLPDQNYLRAVVVTDAAGRARVQTIAPGCYEGHWPHIHFEVFASLEAAVSGRAALLTSLFALPEAEASAVYAVDARYLGSSGNHALVALASDELFGDNTLKQVAAQTLALTGDPVGGFAGRAQVGIAVTKG